MFAQNLIIPSVLLFAGHLTAAELKYPEARKESVTDVYHGTEVKDPYRWLEDDNSAETKAWVSAENAVTDGFIKTIPQRDEIHARLKKLWNFERIGLPYEEGGKWFYSKNSGLQNQSVLYVADTLDGEPRVLLDPNTMSKDGTVALAQSRPSEDGRLLAYATSGGGSDWLEIRVRDIATGKDLADHLKWVKFSGMSWAKDNSGFYYSRYDAPKEGAALTQKNEFQKMYFHRIGDPQEKDTLIFERKDQPQWGIGGGVTEDGGYLIIHLSQGSDTKNRVFYKSLEAPDAEVVQLLPDGDADYGFLGNNGSVFYFKTDLDAPRFRVIAIDTKNPDRKNWKEIIPQAAEPLDSVSKVGGKLIATYMKDAKSRVVRFDADGKNPKELELPGIGTVGGFGGEEKDTSVFYSYASFTNPGAIHQLDLASGESKLWKKPEVGFDGAAYVTEQVFFESKDGTKVPMFIVRKKDAPMDGTNRTLLYGYGGFQINMLPGFSVARAWRHPRRGESAWRWRVWQRVARGRQGFQEAECLRRLHRGCGNPDQEGLYQVRKPRDPGWQQRRPVGRRLHDPASGTLRSGFAGGGCDGHAPLPEIHHRLGMAGGIRQFGQGGGFPAPPQVFALPRAEARHPLPRHAGQHGGP
jgi:prolyl oligopeptidase